jgi:predicted dehydrogenase
MKTIKWCVIGAGGIADRRGIPGLLSDPNNEILAVMDQRSETAKAVAEKYHIAAYFDDVEQMLRSTAFDAAYIATPVFCHYAQALLALKYGLNVFMEKPLAINGAEGKKIVDAFEAAGKQLTVGYMMGYHNLHEKARQLGGSS